MASRLHGDTVPGLIGWALRGPAGRKRASRPVPRQIARAGLGARGGLRAAARIAAAVQGVRRSAEGCIAPARVRATAVVGGFYRA
jgi:hypothetical protein